MSVISWIFPICLFVIVPLITKINTIFLFENDQNSLRIGLCVPLIITTAIFCGIIAVLVFKDSQENGTDLLVTTKPINKNKIIFAKYLVYIVCCCIYSFGIIASVSPYFLYNSLHFKLITTSSTIDIVLVMCDLLLGLLITQAFFGSIAILVSAFRNKLTIILVPTIIVIAGYIVNIVFENAIPTPETYLSDKYENEPHSGSYVAFDKNNNYKLDNNVWLTYNNEDVPTDKMINNALARTGNGTFYYFDIQQQLQVFFHAFSSKEKTYESIHSKFGTELGIRYSLLDAENKKWHDQTNIDFSNWKPPIFAAITTEGIKYPITVAYSQNSSLAQTVARETTEIPVNALYTVQPVGTAYLSKLGEYSYIDLEDINQWASNENFQRYINYLIYGVSVNNQFKSPYWNNGDKWQKQGFYLTDAEMEKYMKNQLHIDGKEWYEGNWFYDGYKENDQASNFGQLGWGGDFTHFSQRSPIDGTGLVKNWQSFGHDYYFPSYRDWYSTDGNKPEQIDREVSGEAIMPHLFSYTFCKDLFENEDSFIYYKNPKSPFYQLVAPDKFYEKELNTIYRVINMCVFQKHVEHFWRWYIWNWQQQNKPGATLPEWTSNEYVDHDTTNKKFFPLVWPSEWSNEFLNNYLVPQRDYYNKAFWEYNGGFPLSDISHSASLQQYLGLLSLYSPYTGFSWQSYYDQKDAFLSTNKIGTTWPPIANSYYPPGDLLFPYYDNSKNVDSIARNGYSNLSQYTNSLNYSTSIIINKTAFTIIYVVFCLLLFGSQAIVFNKLDIK